MSAIVFFSGTCRSLSITSFLRGISDLVSHFGPILEGEIEVIMTATNLCRLLHASPQKQHHTFSHL